MSEWQLVWLSTILDIFLRTSNMSNRRYTPGEIPGEEKAEEQVEVNLEKLTKKELVKIAEEKEIDVEGLDKAGLIEAIEGEEEEDKA